MEMLNRNEFKNILRRSGGLPYAVVSLLHSEPSSKRTNLLPVVIDRLISMGRQYQNTKEKKEKENQEENQEKELKYGQSENNMSIHSLNILKLVMQDSGLKKDTEIFMEDTMILSI